MKKLLFMFLGMLVLASCQQKNTTEDKPVADKWNGYDKYLKCGEKTQNLKDKNNNVIGQVKSGFDNDANFYVKIECSNGKQITKSEVYAGDKKDMPCSKVNDPKEDHFTDKKDHGNGTPQTTHQVPCINLPPCGLPGFTYSAHCKYKDNDGCEHDAWADCHKKFHDKGCGSWDDDYDDPDNQVTLLYGTSYANDSLYLYSIDLTNSTTTLIMREYVGAGVSRCDGAAFDETSGMFFFSTYNSQQLYANQLKDNSPSFLAGTLAGIAASGAFYNNAYYYVSQGTNTINKVTFTSTWTIAAEVILDTIPGTVVVNDIAMNSTGSTLYIEGSYNGGSQELITWDVAARTFYSMSIAINTGAQIAFGSDGVLYAVAPITDGSSHSTTYVVDTASGTLTPIPDDIIIIVDPFSDISSGPTM
jgi:hypothetical protein